MHGPLEWTAGVYKIATKMHWCSLQQGVPCRTSAYQARKGVNPNNQRGDEYGPLWPVPVSSEDSLDLADSGASSALPPDNDTHCRCTAMHVWRTEHSVCLQIRLMMMRPQAPSKGLCAPGTTS